MTQLEPVAPQARADVHRRGPRRRARAMAKRSEAMRMFAEIIEDNIHELMPGCRQAALTAEMIVGGLHEVVLSRVLANRIDELPGW